MFYVVFGLGKELMSSFLSAEELEGFKRLGIAGHIIKPFQVDELFAQLEQALIWRKAA